MTKPPAEDRDRRAWSQLARHGGERVSRLRSPALVRSLKNLCDRLERFHRLKGKRWANSSAPAPVRAQDRPWRDGAIVYILLSTR